MLLIEIVFSASESCCTTHWVKVLVTNFSKTIKIYGTGNIRALTTKKLWRKIAAERFRK